MNEEYKNLSQKDRIINALKVLKEANLDLLKADITFLKKYLTTDDIKVLYKMYMEVEEKVKKGETLKTINQNSSFSQDSLNSELKWHKVDLPNIDIFEGEALKWEVITPYKILKIEEREYTKEELLGIVEQRINFIKAHSIDYGQLSKELDDVLDAYNELTKESRKQI